MYVIGMTIVLPLWLIVSFESFQLTLASLKRKQSFPKIRTLSLDSRTCKLVLITECRMLIGNPCTSPRGRTRLPLAVTITRLEDALIGYLRESSIALVIMLVAAPLLIITSTGCFLRTRYIWQL